MQEKRVLIIEAQSMRAWAALSTAVARHIGPTRAADQRLVSVLSVAASGMTAVLGPASSTPQDPPA